MSEAVDLLLAVQGLDLERVDLLARIAGARAALDDPKELRATRAALDAAETTLRGLSAEQRVIEADIDDHRSKIAGLEKRLYGEMGMNPRTVAPLQSDIAHHKKHIREREDRVMELMIAGEAQESEVRRLHDSVVAGEALHAGELPALRAALAALEAQDATLAARREALASRVPPAALEVYRGLAAARKGRPVVRMTGGTCHGCGATLATAEAQRLRQSTDLPRCPRCGHIVKLE